MRKSVPPKNNTQYLTNNHLLAPISIDKCMSPKECDQIIKLGEMLTFAQAEIAAPDKKGTSNTSIRQSETTWIKPSSDTNWIFNKVQQTIQKANKHYKFDIAGMESIQIARYTINGFYEWHMDVGQGKSSRRKISLTMQLSDANSYTGGDLEFFNEYTNAAYKPNKSLGAAIIFPSFLTHRVTPVTDGERWSLVAWICGNPYR